MKSKRAIALMALFLTLALVPVVLTQAKKPLYCYKTLDIYPPTLDLPVTKRGWISGGIDGYFVVYSFDPPDERTTGQVTHYREEWAIFPDADMGVPFLSGSNTAIANERKMEWRAQGVVEWVDDEYAEGRYADLLGRKWHSYGIFEIPGPVGPINVHLVDTEFRIN